MKPQAEIKVNGTVIADTKTQTRLETLNITDKIGMSADTVDATLFFDGSYALPPIKGKCEARIGNPELWLVGTYIIESVTLNWSRTGGGVLHVRGTSMPENPETVASLQNSHTRSWQSFALKGTTFATIVNEVCAGAGLSADIDGDLAKIEMPNTFQTGETDAEFLTRICSIRDGKVKYSDSKVIIVKKDKTRLPTQTVNFDTHTFMDFNFEEQSRDDIKAVEAIYIDPNGVAQTVTAGGGEPKLVIKQPYPDKETATTAAKSLLAHVQRNIVEFAMTTDTVPNLRAESPVQLQNFNVPQINGLYICYEVTHTFSRGGGLLSTSRLKKRVLS